MGHASVGTESTSVARAQGRRMEGTMKNQVCSLGRAMQISKLFGWGACFALVVVASPAQALTTTYIWGLESDGIRSDAIFTRCRDTDDPSFAVEFPELCGGATPAQLSVAFAHDEPIWDNDASGCNPEEGPEGCDVTIFEEILHITLSGVAFFDPSEVLSFTGLDFRGRRPCIFCEEPAPLIVFDAVDALSGLEVSVELDDFCSCTYTMELLFADGRRFEDDFLVEWSVGQTVPEPGTLALLGLGLLGLRLTRRGAGTRYA
jgi:PEP-CTERM motif